MGTSTFPSLCTGIAFLWALFLVAHLAFGVSKGLADFRQVFEDYSRIIKRDTFPPDSQTRHFARVLLSIPLGLWVALAITLATALGTVLLALLIVLDALDRP